MRQESIPEEQQNPDASKGQEQQDLCRILAWNKPDETTDHYDILHWIDDKGITWRFLAPRVDDSRPDNPPVGGRIWLHSTYWMDWRASWPDRTSRDLSCEGYIFNIRGIEYVAMRFQPVLEVFRPQNAAKMVEKYTGKRLICERRLPDSLDHTKFDQAVLQGTIWPAFRSSYTAYWLAEDLDLFLLPCIVCRKTNLSGFWSEWGGVVCSFKCGEEREKIVRKEMRQRSRHRKGRRTKRS